MIQEHAFNTQWWGEPVGILTDATFFSLTADQQTEARRGYSWVEFRAPLASSPGASDLLQAGFTWVDAQIPFRIGLQRIASNGSLDAMEICSAAEEPFVLESDELMPFRHERYRVLPGSTQEKLNQRYAMWGQQIVNEHPEWCLRLVHDSKTQGWFLSHPSDHGLALRLAMLHRDASVSGFHLYVNSLLAYGERGARIGHERFSVSNVSVFNIYAQLGARFSEPTGCWLWVRESCDSWVVRV